MLAPLIMGLFLLIFAFNLFPVFPWVSRFSARAQYLTTLWQVLAAALALSIAVVLFAFQAASGSQTGTSLKEFAQESHVMQLFYLSLPSLILLGLTLLSAGRNGDPDPQRTSLALMSAGLAFLALPGMLMLSVRALDPETRHKRRLARIRRAVHAAVDEEVRMRLADWLLRGQASAWGLSYLPGPIHGPIPSGFAPVSVQEAGVVRDIRLKRLAKLMPSAGAANLQLVTRIGNTLTEETAVAWVRQGLSEIHVRQIHRIVRVSKRKRASLDGAIDGLHNEAISHIIAQRKSEYEDVAASYRELLLSFPTAWAQYGTPFEPAVAQGLSVFPGDIERVERNLYEELHLALQQGGREVASVAAGIPLGVARGALTFGATALIRDMLRLLREGYRICRLEPALTLAPVMEKRFVTLITEFAKYFVIPDLENATSSDETLERAAGALEVTFAAIRDTLKLMLDGTDYGAMVALDLEWSDLLRYWNPEYAEVRPDTVELRLQGTSNPDEQGRLRDEARRNEEAAARKRRLLGLRDDQRFSLAVWTLRQWLGEVEPDFYKKAFECFVSDFNSLEMVAEVADRTIRYEASELPVWVDWIMYQEARGGALDTLSPALRTFVVLSALRVPTSLGATRLQPYPFVQSSRDTLVQIVAQVRADPQLQSLDASWSLRLDNLQQLVERASEEREALDRAALAAAAVDQAQVDAFRDSVRAGWASGRLGHGLHARFGRVATNRGARPGLMWAESHWLPKRLFLTGPHLESSLAEDLGSRLAQTEMTDFLQALDAVAEAAQVREVFEERLEDAIKELQDAGYNPQVLLCPVSWSLRERLFPGFWPTPGDVPPWLPERAGHWYIGAWRNLICLEWPDLRTDRVYVVDMLHFSEFRQWEEPDGHLVEFRLKTYDLGEASQLAQQKPDLFASAGDDQRRTAEIQQRVVVSAVVRHAVTVLDLRGARYVGVPTELQGSH